MGDVAGEEVSSSRATNVNEAAMTRPLPPVVTGWDSSNSHSEPNRGPRQPPSTRGVAVRVSHVEKKKDAQSFEGRFGDLDVNARGSTDASRLEVTTHRDADSILEVENVNEQFERRHEYLYNVFLPRVNRALQRGGVKYFRILPKLETINEKLRLARVPEAIRIQFVRDYHTGYRRPHNSAAESSRMVESVISISNDEDDDAWDHTEPLPLDIDGEEEWEVEKILNSRHVRLGDGLQYLVKWVGYESEDNTWEPAANLQHAPELISRFHDDHPDKPKPVAFRAHSPTPEHSSAPSAFAQTQQAAVVPPRTPSPSSSVRHSATTSSGVKSPSLNHSASLFITGHSPQHVSIPRPLAQSTGPFDIDEAPRPPSTASPTSPVKRKPVGIVPSAKIIRKRAKDDYSDMFRKNKW